MYYIDGSRIKTDTKFFTPILSPAMKVLEKYDYQLPKISNQKANDYASCDTDGAALQAEVDFPRGESQ